MARTRDKVEATQPATWSEWLLDLGKEVHREIRRGAGIEEVSKRAQTSLDTCKLGLVFFRASDVVKLRALTEDWARDRLILELGGLYRTSWTAQRAGTR